MAIFGTNELTHRSFKYDGAEYDVWIRKLTAGQRVALLRGQVMEATAGGKDKPTFKVDLGDQTERNHKLVQYTICKENGDRLFKTLKDVQEEHEDVINLLARLSSEINKEDEDPGKS